MNKLTTHICQILWEKYGSQLKLEDGLVNQGTPGHTIDASKVTEAHNGKTTSLYYVMGTLLGDTLDEEHGLRILEALSQLQITDESSPYFGAFRWFREDTRVNDSNAAFFILKPLVVLLQCQNDRVPSAHRELLDRMLNNGAAWFARELEDPILYYSNKIVSDGALLLSISRIYGLEKYYQTGTEFFERWLTYTSQRGWGWGENVSLGYLAIIMNALKIACMSLTDENRALLEKLKAVMDHITDYVRFHGGYEFVPAIRSYNFAGELQPDSFLWRIAGIKKTSSEDMSFGKLDSSISYLLFEDELHQVEQVVQLPVPRTRVERIMDTSTAYTWVGVTGRLGSVNRFPVIAGSYQFPTWGLGWQSYPVSLAVDEHQVSFLCWHVHNGERIRTHPATYGSSYLGPALFREQWLPDIQLRSVQRENVVLVVRSISGIHNEASEIADEWVVNRWTGERITVAGSDGREWTILQYPNSAVLITPLLSIRYGENIRSVPEIMPVTDGDKLRLRQVLYEGETKLLQQPRLESGWAIYYADGVGSLSQATALAARLRLEEASFKDGEVPRNEYTKIRRVSLFDGEAQLAELVVDPHQDHK